MISGRHKFIFLHVPKTAGNAVQSYLLPFSDDRKVVGAYQDGVERFGVAGEVTPTKHATLADYARVLGPALDEYRVILPIRDPIDRALSLYFSPHRAFGRPAGFVPAFDLDVFARLIADMPGIVDYLRVEGVIRSPDFLLRFDNLAADLAAVAASFGWPAPALPVLNASLDRDGQRDRLRGDPAVAGLVRKRFAEDYELFGFSTAPGPATA